MGEVRNLASEAYHSLGKLLKRDKLPSLPIPLSLTVMPVQLNTISTFTAG